MKRHGRHDAVLAMLADYVVLLSEAAGVFRALVAGPREHRSDELEVLKAVEREADEKCAALTQQIARTITSMAEREDVYRLLESLDDEVDALAQAGSLVVAFDPLELPSHFVQHARLLEQMTKAVSHAVDELATPGHVRLLVSQFRAEEVELRTNRAAVMAESPSEGTDDPVRTAQIAILLKSVDDAVAKLDDVVRSLDVVAVA